MSTIGQPERASAGCVPGMDQFMPSWRNHREELNRSPLGHEEWEY